MGDTPAGGSKEAIERSAAQAVTTPEGSISGRLDLVGRFARLARALEAAGLYNATKALRAGADRELTRVAAPAAQLRRGDVLRELEGVRRDVAAAGYPEWFVGLLHSAEEAIRADTSLLYRDAPPVWTCRVCGELALDTPPDLCPTCGAPAVSFRGHAAVWYLEADGPTPTLALLRDGPRQVERALDGRTAQQLDRAPRPGEWSARETLRHITSAEVLLSTRVRRMLEENDPELVAWQPGDAPPPSDEATDYRADAGADELLAHYRRLRLSTVNLLTDIAPDAWQRPGRHPEWGPVTVLSQASYFARHQAAHQAQLAAAVEGRVPGEPRKPGS